MNTKFFTLALISTVVAGATALASADPAMAQGARFKFEANEWGTQKFKQRHQYRGPQHAVSSGHVPTNMLGIDPTFVAKVPPPAPIQIPATRPAMTSTTPRILPRTQPVVTGQYKPSFGQPAQPQELVAHQPPALSVPKELSAKPAQQASKGVSARLAPRAKHHASKSVAAKLQKRHAPTGAAATPKIASYGNNKFYTPGGHNPASTGSGSRTNSSVYGTVIKH
ncbi:MAG: hypothetical protein K8F91_02160 [Candidatus Obscuribacterales bacterium]|nr:hypothetical protein [Candidatus Obscuribacterales bacterium]